MVASYDQSLFLMVCILGRVKGTLKIVPPLPGHSVAIENETLTVTCVAFDEANPNVKPLGFEFYRLDQAGDKIPIVDGGDYELTNKTEVNGRKLIVSLLFKRIKSTDNGRYECKILNTSDITARYGFGVTYVPYVSLPQISTSKNRTVELGDDVTLQCNLTETGARLVTLVTMEWIKDDGSVTRVPRPAEIKLRDISMMIDSAEDGGFYQCRLSTVLHQQRVYNVTELIIVKVKPKFFTQNLRHNRIVRNKGEPVEMICNATGNPIIVVWKRKPRNGNKNLTIETDVGLSSNESQHYELSSDTPYEGFKLTIDSTDYSDRGHYYCCIRSTNTSDDEVCQRYILRIKDPLGYLWPLIGIAIEAIVLGTTIYISEKYKEKKELKTRSNVKMKFQYTVTDEDGQVRLRRTSQTEVY